MKHIPTNKSKKKKVLVIVTVCLVVVVAIATPSYILLSRRNNARSISTTPEPEQSINFDPPTEEEKVATEEHKEQLAANSTPRPGETNADGRKKVSPVITSASGTNVSAYVTGVFESNGTCTITATSSSGNVVTISSEGFENVSYTQCAPLSFSPALSSGSWNIKITYSSPGAYGVLDGKAVTVP